ncbi:MAG: HAMP domain-containing sensor histidine kinase [Sphingomonadaceae bacterium]
MAAIPIVEFDQGMQTVTRGTLHDCPVEFFTKPQMSFYLNCRTGWSTCPMGYSCYSAFDAMGRKMVIPGIILEGEQSRPRKKFPNYSIRFHKNQIEEFIIPHLKTSETIKEVRDNEFKNLTHDLRAIGAEIYNTALTARGSAERFGDDLVRQLDSVLAAQQMLSLRLDIVDYESGHSAGRPKEPIPVFRKIDKVLRCFQNRFYNSGVTYRTNGVCYANVQGPPIFEIIPFVLVENAIKYAPRGSNLDVNFEEKENEVLVRFESFGPKIKDNEKDRIFDQHFRGEEAQASQSSGSGIGLYAAKTLTEAQYNGNLYVNQIGDPVWVNHINYFKTRFTLVLPTIDDDRLRDRNRRLRRRRSV